MSPDALSPGDWDNLRYTIVLLWALLPAIVLCGGSLLVGQAILPSLVSTKHLSPGWARLRAPLGLFSFVSGAVAALILWRVVTGLPALLEFYPRFWQ